MAKYIRAVQLPSRDLVAIDNIMGVKRLGSGVGLLDARNRMIGWLEMDGQNDCDEQYQKVMDIFNDLINNRRRAEQPDWSFLSEKPSSELPRAKTKASNIVIES